MPAPADPFALDHARDALAAAIRSNDPRAAIQAIELGADPEASSPINPKLSQSVAAARSKAFACLLEMLPRSSPSPERLSEIAMPCCEDPSPEALACLRLALAMGADPLWSPPESSTHAAHLAFLSRNPPAFCEFVRQGMSPDAITPSIGLSPIGYAILSGSQDALRFMIQSGARLDLPCKKASPKERPEHADIQRLPLAFAAQCGKVDLVQTLLQAGDPMDLARLLNFLRAQGIGSESGAPALIARVLAIRQERGEMERETSPAPWTAAAPRL